VIFPAEGRKLAPGVARRAVLTERDAERLEFSAPAQAKGLHHAFPMVPN
jgi:hypothetical protein